FWSVRATRTDPDGVLDGTRKYAQAATTVLGATAAVMSWESCVRLLASEWMSAVKSPRTPFVPRKIVVPGAPLTIAQLVGVLSPVPCQLSNPPSVTMPDASGSVTENETAAPDPPGQFGSDVARAAWPSAWSVSW